MGFYRREMADFSASLIPEHLHGLVDATQRESAAAAATSATTPTNENNKREELLPESWMYSPGPHEGDLLQLQWMRAESHHRSLPRRTDPLDMNFAIDPIVVDPMKLLPPVFFIPPVKGEEISTVAAQECVKESSSIHAVMNDLVAALRRDANWDADPVVARVAQLREDEWVRLLSDSSTPFASLSALQFSILLIRLENIEVIPGGDFCGAPALARSLLNPDLDALPRALRAHRSSSSAPNTSVASTTCDLQSSSAPVPLTHSQATRLARALLRMTPLGVCGASEFRRRLVRLGLRERAGKPGIELETCLGECYFSVL
mmetsp:Transcript_15882/g.31725  ORF Transcript_15882/g.31725 Transcript_15882/m.31725 type:complete len:318 (-) Transcript_15882:117-1070(-)